MLVSPKELIDRSRFGAERAHDLARLRARFHAYGGPAKPEERRLALELGEAKRALAESFAEVRSCRSCAVGCALPKGHWPGGRCCGTETLTVFSPAEVRALAVAGRGAPTEAAGFAERAGCAFRGPTGCTLEPEARPARCLLYLCDELSQELASAPDDARSATVRSRRALSAIFDRFREVALAR